jgi:hypothetical protein
MNKNWIIALVVIVVALLAWSWFARSSEPVSPPTTTADPSALPGMRTTEAPWGIDVGGLPERLKADNLAQLKEEGQVLHIHQHLDIIVNGQPVAVPANIGVAATYISPIHTHDTRGILHVESPIQATFTLGNFFDVWGVLLTADCIGGYCANASSTLGVYVDGQKVEGDPRLLELASHQQIAVVYHTGSSTPPAIPSTFEFGPNE